MGLKIVKAIWSFQTNVLKNDSFNFLKISQNFTKSEYFENEKNSFKKSFKKGFFLVKYE